MQSRGEDFVVKPRREGGSSERWGVPLGVPHTQVFFQRVRNSLKGKELFFLRVQKSA
jgi:hypothetical protein